MKKIMIALAAVGMAFMANAAAVTWSVYNYDDVTGPISGMFTGTMYINCSEAGIVNQAVDVTAGQFSVNFDSDCAWETDYTLTLTGSMVVGDKTYTYSATSTDANVDSMGNGTGGFDAGSWSSDPTPPLTPTPEPTSGLLLLVGMAGLALRRRRA